MGREGNGRAARTRGVAVKQLSYEMVNVPAARIRLDLRRDVVSFAIAGCGVVGLGAAHGGYFSTAWGWEVVARATSGKTQRAALAQATKLDPLSPELAAFRSDRDSQAGISITAGARP